MKAIDVHGFGGGFTLGTVQAGFDLVAKFSREAGFGVHSTLANRHLLGDGWDSITGMPDMWDTMEADYVFGNPPCSGFSTLTNRKFKGATGMDAAINQYMWELIRYAARVKPQVVAWESVQGTFRSGLPLMRTLHEALEAGSGLKYDLIHVLHNNASVGGIANRKRYFWVASRVPFGVESSRVTPAGEIRPLDIVPVLNDGLTDLEELRLTMSPQMYRGVVHVGGEQVLVLKSSDWARREMHDGSGVVDGHDVAHSPTLDRARQLLELEEWNPGETMSTVLRRYYERTGELPPRSYEYITTGGMPKGKKLIDTDFAMGYNQPNRWHGDRLANVITGGGVHLVIHPRQPRTLTHREVARIQGFPDAWRIYPIRNVADIGPAWGKGVPVQAGRWVSTWVRESLEGRPGSLTGEPLADKMLKKYGPYDRERVIDITYDFKAVQDGGQ